MLYFDTFLIVLLKMSDVVNAPTGLLLNFVVHCAMTRNLSGGKWSVETVQGDSPSYTPL